MSDGPEDATSDGFSAAMSDAPTEATPDVADVQVADVADATCTVSPIVDYCAALPPLSAAPIIDGVLDCGPALVAIAPVDWNGPPPLPPFPPGNSAELAAAWRPDGLYVFVSVTTPAAFSAEAADPVFYGAGVELFVDDDGVYASAPTYDNPGAIQLVVAAPPDATTTGRRAEGFRNAADEGPGRPRSSAPSLPRQGSCSRGSSSRPTSASRAGRSPPAARSALTCRSMSRSRRRR
ncbi:MAG TPA: hypothetical protein VII82_07210 [Polyangiaceae bacterium]